MPSDAAKAGAAARRRVGGKRGASRPSLACPRLGSPGRGASPGCLAADNLRRACAYRDGRGRRRLPEWREPQRYRPAYNRGPQAYGPVLLARRHLHQDADPSERVLVPMRWGLVPAWFKEDNPSKMQYSTFNCRSDTMMEKLSYRGPLVKGRRCVVLADGFYEWQQRNGEKQPYFIYFPQTKQEMSDMKEEEGNEEEEWKGKKLLTMAGIFDCWQPPNGGDPLYTYTIITVNASKAISFIHNRMPAILDGDEAIRKWLDFAEVPTQEAVKLIQPTEHITFYPVSTLVSNSRNDTPECLTPIELGLKQETKASASSKMMLDWLKNKSPKKQEDDLPRWSSQFIQAATPKRTSANVMHQWLKKEEGESPAKRPKI
ncbi:embryonic stem cell-specific 5-hydroxymethylcytosine-binding protein [Alligator mississippiensis]|uniref:Abasic site processing protein HMCES n=1 Tax=Alligator mississippiensis TaxID=8496 RepID=A0A151MJX0_ALLMI|nr:embryonic stem cell-specific 5-hydroxymethylcytosine-binding protein [Alligator mississippiensis]